MSAEDEMDLARWEDDGGYAPPACGEAERQAIELLRNP